MAVSADLELFRPAPLGDFRSSYATQDAIKLVGTIGSGLPLTISTDGTVNFGTKPQSTPYIYDQFNGTDGQLLNAYDPLWVKYGGGVDGAVISSARTRYYGSKSAYNDYLRNGFDTNTRSFPDTKKLHMSYWVYADLPAAGTGGQIKLSRINTAPDVYNGDGTFFISSWFPNTGDYCHVDIDTGAGISNLGSVNVKRNQWFKIEYFIDHSTAGVADGSCLIRVNNGEFSQGAIGTVMTRESGQTFLANSTILGVMLANQVGDFNMKIHNTDVKLDAGWNRVVVSNTATIGATSIVEDQNYSSWSTTEITLPSLNYGAIPAPSRKYLKVFNDSNAEILSVRIA